MFLNYNKFNLNHFFKLKKFIILISLIVWGISANGFCADFQAGMDAFNQQDYSTAIKQWEQLAEQGDAKAQFLLGAMYYDGKGLKKDYQQAVYFYRLSADQGLALAEHALAAMYEKGEGVTQEYERAFYYYTLSAEQGYVLA